MQITRAVKTVSAPVASACKILKCPRPPMQVVPAQDQGLVSHRERCTHEIVRTLPTGQAKLANSENESSKRPPRHYQRKDATPCPDCPVTTAGGLLQPTRHQKSSEHEEPERRPRRCCCRRRPRSRGSVFRRILGARSGDLPSWSCDVSLASGSFRRSRDSLHTPTIAKTEK